MKSFIITVERKRVKGRLSISVYKTDLTPLIVFDLKSNSHCGIENETINILEKVGLLLESEVVRNPNSGYPISSSSCKFITFESTDIMYIDKNF